MITVKLMGGIGNQMFEYAFGRYLAQTNGSELCLDLSFLEGTQKGVTRRKYELDAFNIKAGLVSGNSKGTHIKESSVRFDPKLLELKGDLCLDGYWQSEKYFMPVEKLIRQEFSFKEALDTVPPNESVGVHVRRGDYVSDKRTKEFHGCCGADYYAKASAYVLEKCPDPVFYVFSDDIGWVSANMTFPGKTVFVKGDSAAPAADMQMMSRCSHQIIANSSFSWWAAWLNDNPDKIVVAPKKWFVDEKQNIFAADLIPESWTRL